MKIKIISIITSVLILIVCNNRAFSMESTPAEIVLSYFQACEDGEINKMKSLITGKFYNRRRALIEANEEYPEFLRNHYFGIWIDIVSSEVDSEKGNAQVMLKQIFPSGNTVDATLILSKNNDGFWKISNEVMPE